jgi:hypothetical protein
MTTTKVTEEKVFTEADLATLLYPTDRWPYLIVRRTRTTLTMVRINVDNLPEGAMNFPYTDYSFTVEEAVARKMEGEVKAYYSRKSRMFKLHGCPIRLGEARYFRDWTD